MIGKVDGYVEEKNWNKYLNFVSTNENKDMLIKYTKFWDKIKNDLKNKW